MGPRHDYGPSGSGQKKPINWNALGLAVTLAALLIGWASGAFGAAAAMDRRITTLETQRIEDKAATQRLEQSIEKMNDKLDLLLQRKP